MKARIIVSVLIATVPAVSPAGLHSFPSGGSTVTGSVGFIDSEQIGWFWSAARGDKVQETFADALPSVDRAIFNFAVPDNVLSTTPVDWDVLINSTRVGSFEIGIGLTGPMHLDLSSAPIASVAGQYTVTFAVTNVVPPGAGAQSLAYAGTWPHAVELLGTPVVPAPAALLLGGLGAGLVAGLRRRRIL